MRKKAAKPPKQRKKPARVWHQYIPYGFMGTVFILGFLALFAVVAGELGLAGRIILAAMVIAGMEYYSRRFISGPSSLEHEFSALADFFCFALVPGLLMYQLAFRGWGILGLIGLFVVVFGALIRLSLFKLYNPLTSQRGFIGLPVTMSAACIALVAQLIGPEHITPTWRLLFLGVMTSLMFLTVSTIRYPNPTERPAVFGLAALMVAVIFAGGQAAGWSSGLLLCGGTAYIIIAPLGAGKRERG
ncbi:hypothetical protein JW933_11200 [candidate division FCPU426 bacterium]|nr:hypothetical protein [candidate division FCPU426 bacterium]